MYSKVKERAARAVSQSEAQVKEFQPLVCPKVVLKRRTNHKNSNAVPTYKSTLQIKPISIRVKKRKRHDVLRDYRRRKSRSARKRNVDENKNLHKLHLTDDNNNDDNNNNGTLLPSIMKPRTVISHSKSPVKNEILTSESASVSEYSKVLQELPANDEISSTDALDFTSLPLPNFNISKLLMESRKIHQTVKSDESFTNLKDIFKSGQQRTSENGKEFSSEPAGSTNSQGNASNLYLKHRAKSISNSHISRLNVVSSHQTEIWRTLKLKDLVEKVLSLETGGHVTHRHTFDLIMASSIQGRIDIIEKLCLRGASLNQVLGDGTTMIMIVSQMGLHDVVRVFLKFSAHKDIQNQYGETALMLACRHKYPKVVKVLLEHGANFALNNADGINALRISNTYAEDTEVPNIMKEHICRMKLEFEGKVMSMIDHIAEIRHALFPLHCFSLNEGPKFIINFAYDAELESPGKGRKEYLLFISNCTIKGSCIRCEFSGDSPVLSVSLNGAKQDSFKKGNNFLVKISCLLCGNNEMCITTAQRPQSEVKLVVCAYRVSYRRSISSRSAENVLINAVHF